MNLLLAYNNEQLINAERDYHLHDLNLKLFPSSRLFDQTIPHPELAAGFKPGSKFVIRSHWYSGIPLNKLRRFVRTLTEMNVMIIWLSKEML